MFWKALGKFDRFLSNDMRWKLRYQLFKRVLPRLQYEPFTIQHLSCKAWPVIVAKTANDDYTDGIKVVEWQSGNTDQEGTQLMQDYAEASRPIVIRGYAKDCPMSSWSLDTLKLEFGDEIVEVKAGDYQSEFGQPQNCSMKLATFIDYLQGKGEFPEQDKLFEDLSPYLGNRQIPRLAKKLLKTGFIDHHQAGNDLTTFWLGSVGALTPLHCHHFCDVFVTQLIGKRSFTLIPPHQALMVGYVCHNLNIGSAAFDPFSNDQGEFPGAEDIQAMEIELGPGDCLILPGFWFHAIKLSEPSLSASRFVKGRMPLALGGGPPEPWKAADDFVRGW
jgi:hypothetical protein